MAAGAYPLSTGLQVVWSNCGVFFKELYQKPFPKSWLSPPRHRKGGFLGTALGGASCLDQLQRFWSEVKQNQLQITFETQLHWCKIKISITQTQKNGNTYTRFLTTKVIKSCYTLIKTFDKLHRRTGRGGEGGCRPPKFWATQIFWAARENLGKASL